MPDRSDDYRKFIESKFDDLHESIERVGSDIRTTGASINARLDKVNGRLDKHDDAIRSLQLAQAREDGAHAREGRVTPSRELRSPGDEEMTIRVTPKMWAALTAAGAVLYTVLHYVFNALKGAGAVP